jgi:anti-sigma factor RsiW
MIGSENDKQLWRRFADAQGSPPTSSPLEGEADELLLAAWIDGRLEGAEREAVEARLAGDPALLDLAVSAARSRNLSAPWPKRAETRAAALIVLGPAQLAVGCRRSRGGGRGRARRV